MQEMYDADLLYQATPSSPWQYKKYLADAKGVKLEDLWDDIGGARGNERTGYPTQKPVALAERIIKASCPEGGVVLDCFAGCAYVAVAAERLGRSWVACDINARAWTVFKRQFSKPKLVQLTCLEPRAVDNQQMNLLGNIVTVHGPSELPQDTIRTVTTPNPLPPPKPPIWKEPASDIPRDEMLRNLLELSGYQAWCCGFANRMPDGTIIKTTRNFHLDHMDPVSREGSSHQITNRAPLCMEHNIRKSNQRLHLAEYRQQIANAGELMVHDLSDLINLSYARHEAENLLTQARMAKGFQSRLPSSRSS